MKCKLKLDLLQKTVLLLIGLILITFFIQFAIYSLIKYRKKHEKIQEGMSASKMLDQMGNGLKGIGKSVEGIGKIIGTIFALPKELNNLFKGIRKEFKCGQNEFDDGFKYGLQTFVIIISCCWDKFVKFFNGTCTYYYIIDIIWGVTVGLFIMLPISIIDAIFGIDLKILITSFYDLFLVPIDEIFFSICGFHLFQWSDSVIRNCYRCKGKMNGKTYYKKIDEWSQLFNCSNAEIRDGAYRMTEAIIPGEMWFEWFKGNFNV